MAAIIRPAREEDRRALYEVVLKTADNGGDATALHRLPDVQGDVYAGPYLAFEPELAFVLDDDQGPAGFVLGALDTRRFEERLEQEWWPPLRLKYKDAESRGLLPDDKRLLRLIYDPQTAPESVLPGYPSHLHIDILPRQQGKGSGRKLIETLFGALAARGSPGVHLFVGARNQRAIAFYQRMGMTAFATDERVVGMCRKLAGR